MTPGEPALNDPTPQDPQLVRGRDGEALARRSLDEPLFSSRPRCPRCGERLESADDPECPRCRADPRSAEAGKDLEPAGRWYRELLTGATYMPRGLLRLVRSPSLWKFAIVPLLINIGVVLLTLTLGNLVFGWLRNTTAPGALSNWTGLLWGSLSWIAYFLGLLVGTWKPVALAFISAWLIVAFPFSILYKLVFMPFMELLTEAAERAMLGLDDAQPFELARFYANLVIATVNAAVLTLLQGALYVLLFPLNLLVGPGTIAWVLLPPLAFAGFDYSDMNLVRRGYSSREKVRLWSAHRWRLLGYGVCFFFFLVIPVLNCLAIPSAAVGGALLYLELARK